MRSQDDLIISSYKNKESTERNKIKRGDKEKSKKRDDDKI